MWRKQRSYGRRQFRVQSRKFKGREEGGEAHHRGSRGATEGTEGTGKWDGRGHSRNHGSGVESGAVEELANGVPRGATGGMEGFFLSVAPRLTEKIADLDEHGSLLGRDTPLRKSAGQGAGGTAEIGCAGGTIGERREFAPEIVLTGGARSERAVGIAKAVTFGMGGESAVASVGKGETTEGRVRIVLALARHE